MPAVWIKISDLEPLVLKNTKNLLKFSWLPRFSGFFCLYKYYPDQSVTFPDRMLNILGTFLPARSVRCCAVVHTLWVPSVVVVIFLPNRNSDSLLIFASCSPRCSAISGFCPEFCKCFVQPHFFGHHTLLSLVGLVLEPGWCRKVGGESESWRKLLVVKP